MKLKLRENSSLNGEHLTSKGAYTPNFGWALYMYK